MAFHRLSILPFSAALGLRYLRPKRDFVSLITVLSIVGVALGVQILAFVVAIMTGYDTRMRETVLGFEPHLDVHQSGVLYDWEPVLETLRAHPEVTDAAPFSHGQVVLDVDRQLRVVRLQGLRPEPGPILDRLRLLVREGEFDLSDDHIVIGRALADKLGISLRDTVLLHSLANGRQLLEAHREGTAPTDLVVPAELTVVGIFNSGRHSYDSQTVFVPLEVGQTLYNLQWGVHGLMAQVEDPYEVDRVRDALLPVLEPPLNVTSWIDRNRAKFEFIATNRLLIYFLMFMIVIVAGFSIMNTMITVTSQKRREIGILKAVGARMDQLVGIFLTQGFAVGAIGSLLGLMAGILLLAFRQELRELLAVLTRREIFEAEVYDFYELPAHLTATDLVVICGGAFLACSAAALIPAWLSARLDAARALRNESTV